MELVTRDGALIVVNGQLAGQCECCACGPCCWNVTELGGCPGPTVTVSNAGKTLLLCFQDSIACGDISCLHDQEQSGGCTNAAPCPHRQYIRLTTTFTIKEPVTLTVSLQGRVEANAGTPCDTGGIVDLEPGTACRDVTDVFVGDIGVVHIGTDSAQAGGGYCDMSTVQNSEQFEVPAGCLKITVISDTGDGKVHFGMYSRVTLTFSDDTKVATCAGKLCTTFECVVVESKSSDEKTGLAPDQGCTGGIVDLENGVEGCEGSTVSCVPVKTSASQPGVELNECVIDCAQGKCENVKYYCCVDEVEDSQAVVNPNPIRRDCKKKTLRVCSTDDSGTVDTTIPPGAFRTLAECRENCQPEGYQCLDSVCTPTDDPEAPYATLAECEQACLGRFICDDMGECIQTADPNAPHENRAACEEECEQRFVCAPNGGCYQSADGPYATLAECEQNCDPPPDGIYCVLVNNETLCKPGPIPEGETILSGPHPGYLSCYEVCRKHACTTGCGGVQKCKPSSTGAYQTLGQCLEGCTDTAADPCTLEETTGVGPGVFPFEIDAAERDVCISYVSIGGQAIRLRAQYKRINPLTCKPDGIWGPTSDWRGHEECDCRDLRPGGPLKGGPNGYISFRKPKGITEFSLIVQAPCPDTDVHWTVRCTGAPCSEPEEPDPIGACCIAGVCQDGVKKSQCDSFNGKWLGPCTECEPDDCVDPRGACCLPDGTCLERTEAECDTAGGVYHGDGVPCRKVTCPPPPLRGACCFGDGCTVGITQEECEFWNGTYLGDNSTCGPPDPCRGCCCEGTECYPNTYENDCTELFEGEWSPSSPGDLCCRRGPYPEYAASTGEAAYYIHLTTDCPESWLNGVTIPLTSKFTNNCAFSCVQNFQGNLGVAASATTGCADAWVAMRHNAGYADLFGLRAHLRTYQNNQATDLTISCDWNRQGITNENLYAGRSTVSVGFFNNEGNPAQSLCFPVSKTKFGSQQNYHAGVNDYAFSGCPPTGNHICGGATVAGCKAYYGPEAANMGVTLNDDDLCNDEYLVYVEISPLP